MKISFIGDAHGRIERLLIEAAKLKDSEHVFQVGDMGLGFQGVTLPKLNPTFRFIRGNHDDPALCHAHPNFLGDYGYLPDFRMFYLGGAFSVDSEWRKAHMAKGGSPVWWPDEELSPAVLDVAIEAYVKARPLVMMSHEAPAHIVRQVVNQALIIGSPGAGSLKLECIHSRTSQALAMMFLRHQPRHWIFGHYHVNKDIQDGLTHFHCCPELESYTLDIT